MTAFRDRPEFKRGRAGELRVSAWLQERGWYVIPSYDYAGEDGDKPPRLQGFKMAHPVPDLDIARLGTRRWVEVKTKKLGGFLWRKTGKLQHGINLRLLEHYQTVQEITGSECWIAIYEETTRALLAQTINRLGPPRIGTNNGTQIANWDRDKFIQLHVFGDDLGAS